MVPITENDLALFREGAKTELKSTGDIGRLAWDDVVEALCKEVARLRSGDAAKLREALMQIYERVNSLDENCGVDPVEIRDIARSALAAPPRNCDKYATADEALKAQEQMFNDSNFANGECKLGCPECDNPRVGCKIAWLFAPATEKEGGNNGK